MNRLQELIGRLKEQSEQQAAPSQMLATTQLIEAELQRMSVLPPNGTAGTNGRGSAKVAVMMPSAVKNAPVARDSRAAVQTDAYAYNRYNTPGNPPLQEAAPAREPVASREPALPPQTASSPGPVFPDQEDLQEDKLREDQPAQVNGTHAAAGPSAGSSKESAPAPKEPAMAQKEPLNGAAASLSKESRSQAPPPQAPLPKDPVSISWSFDPMTDIPTLSHQSNPGREINDVIGNGHTSLNDRLKGNVLDLAAALNDAPIRDLRKAIGLNDRYVFINELFRGDETMYERSIKTINGFRILPEAEYWMQRELKVKMGWDETRSSTRHFYQLVKRRFS